MYQISGMHQKEIGMRADIYYRVSHALSWSGASLSSAVVGRRLMLIKLLKCGCRTHPHPALVYTYVTVPSAHYSQHAKGSTWIHVQYRLQSYDRVC